MRSARSLLLVLSLLSLASCASSRLALESTACPPLSTAPTEADSFVSDCRQVTGGSYQFQYLHVVAGGKLLFVDDGQPINLVAKSILIEQGGEVQAGTYDTPYGLNGGKLVIGLYGAGPAQGASNPLPGYAPIQCKDGTCYPSARVGMGCLNTGAGFDPTDPCQAPLAGDHSQDNSYFEGYDHDHGTADTSLFGYKVLAVSYGGSLRLFGAKGVAPQFRSSPDTPLGTCPVPSAEKQTDITQWAALTGNSWARANATAAAGASTLQLDRAVDWTTGDQVIVGTTDWSTSHSELVTVAGPVTSTNQLPLSSALQYAHNGQPYTVPAALASASGNPNGTVENRAAVGLLSRSITIRSLGATPDTPFPSPESCGVSNSTPDCYFGGHVMVRQGFATFQVQGVEFYQLGQGGNLGRYPVHFHMLKDASYTNAFIRDSSIWDSNTRFVTVHASHHVEVSRNVGYLSMGHGYYIEDGSEIENLFCQNLGVSSRAAFTQYCGLCVHDGARVLAAGQHGFLHHAPLAVRSDRAGGPQSLHAELLLSAQRVQQLLRDPACDQPRREPHLLAWLSLWGGLSEWEVLRHHGARPLHGFVQLGADELRLGVAASLELRVHERSDDRPAVRRPGLRQRRELGPDAGPAARAGPGQHLRWQRQPERCAGRQLRPVHE